MKKILLSTIAFSLVFGLAVAVKANDVVVNTDQVTVNTTGNGVAVTTDQATVNTTSNGTAVTTDQVAVKTTSGTATVSVKTDGLEKISNPLEIKNFGQIVKKENALWGIRKKMEVKRENKATSTKEMKQENKKKETEMKKGEKLEKITSLDDVKYFTNIRKVGDALWGIRKEVKVQEMKKIASSSISCVTDAINTKDTALKTIFGSYSTQMNLLIDARNACQIAALDNENQLAVAKTCANAFQKAVKTGNETIVKARNEAWKAYTEKLKSCVGSTSTPTVLNLEDGGAAIGNPQL